MCSLAESDQEGFSPLSLNAKGLPMDDREDRLCRWMLLTKGRTENPPVKGDVFIRLADAALWSVR